MSPELDTLDQLQGSDMTLAVIRQIFPTQEHFTRGLVGLLTDGAVRLLKADDSEVPAWQWREILTTPDTWPNIRLSLVIN